MELPKNITQIGETNPHCKVYVEDYVISYIKQLNQFAAEKELAVALYGVRKEEAGITYLFLYGACRITFLQKECRHLSQAVQQEVEKQRKKFFSNHIFLGYRILNGEMVEGFFICEQNVCRYVEGYAQFYEKNDAMLAFMLEERQEASAPETVDQEKYNVVKKRQEERRAQAAERGGHAFGPRPSAAPVQNPAPNALGGRLKNMKIAAAAVFTLLCVAGLASMENGGKLGEWQMAIRQLMEDVSQKQLPDVVEVSNGSAQVGTIVAEDRLTDAILNENASADSSEAFQETGTEQGSSQEGTPGTEQGSGQEGTPGTEQGSGQEGTPGTEQGGSQEGTPGTEQGGSQEGTSGTEQGSGQEGTPGTEQGGSQEGTPGTEQEGSQEAVPGNEQVPAAGPAEEMISYTVKRGDTLTSICIQNYGSDARVSEVCSLNNINNPDDIKEGEKIFLPQ